MDQKSFLTHTLLSTLFICPLIHAETIHSLTQVTQGVSHTLEFLVQHNGLENSGFQYLVAQLDSIPSVLALEEAMQSLVPPFNYGLVAGSHIGMDNAFESVIKRLGHVRGLVRASFEEAPSFEFDGMNFGEDYQSCGSLWVKVLGAHLHQGDRLNVPGYSAKGAGIAFGSDWNISEWTTLGIAASYTKVNVDDKNASPKDQDIHSWQATAYGWWQIMDVFYLDAMLGAATNHYRTNRVINVNDIHTATQASFDGAQFGAQADLGWNIDWCDGYFTPFFRLKYIALNLKDYIESGAGVLDLRVQNDDINELVGGVGVRVGNTLRCRDITYVPEFSAMVAYAFQNDGEQTVAGFVGGGPAFGTDGIQPGRMIIDFGLGVNAYLSPCSIFSAKYDLELRSQFVSNAIYLQYNYLWS